MGEEYGEESPFPYFTSHSDPDLVGAVKKGRTEEFAAFQWEGEAPDPQDDETFFSARLNHQLREKGPNKTLLSFYKALIRLRIDHPVLRLLSKEKMEVCCLEEKAVLSVRRWHETDQIALVFHFGDKTVSLKIPLARGRWEKRLDSADRTWQGPGSLVPSKIQSLGQVTLSLPPKAFVLFDLEEMM
jgi:maltooligosyltrehalose trehalohydrolase